MALTYYFHDYETFGADPRRDRPAQFAGIRTDADFNVVAEPTILYCRPPTDYLPDPEACLITGITPQLALEQGVREAEFAAAIHREMSQPQTCVRATTASASTTSSPGICCIATFTIPTSASGRAAIPAGISST